MLEHSSPAPPTPPQHPEYSVSQYSLDSFTVSVEWESPASDGGVGIDSYTLTGAGITAPLTVLSNEPLTATLTLSYNEMHMVSITASNCAGESTASLVTIREGKSPAPITIQSHYVELVSPCTILLAGVICMVHVVDTSMRFMQ